MQPTPDDAAGAKGSFGPLGPAPSDRTGRGRNARAGTAAGIERTHRIRTARCKREPARTAALATASLATAARRRPSRPPSIPADRPIAARRDRVKTVLIRSSGSMAGS